LKLQNKTLHFQLYYCDFIRFADLNALKLAFFALKHALGKVKNL